MQVIWSHESHPEEPHLKTETLLPTVVPVPPDLILYLLYPFLSKFVNFRFSLKVWSLDISSPQQMEFVSYLFVFLSVHVRDKN